MKPTKREIKNLIVVVAPPIVSKESFEKPIGFDIDNKVDNLFSKIDIDYINRDIDKVKDYIGELEIKKDKVENGEKLHRITQEIQYAYDKLGQIEKRRDIVFQLTKKNPEVVAQIQDEDVPNLTDDDYELDLLNVIDKTKKKYFDPTSSESSKSESSKSESSKSEESVLDAPKHEGEYEGDIMLGPASSQGSTETETTKTSTESSFKTQGYSDKYGSRGSDDTIYDYEEESKSSGVHSLPKDPITGAKIVPKKEYTEEEKAKRKAKKKAEKELEKEIEGDI